MGLNSPQRCLKVLYLLIIFIDDQHIVMADGESRCLDCRFCVDSW
jgi:hypothetical protein